MSNDPIYVTMPSLAPFEEYTEILRNVWESGILTHNGPLVQKFEKELQFKLGVENFISVVNGTIAIQMAIKALGLKGEIITTPFTWIATVSAIKWEGCIPVFCDIDPETLNIDPTKIEDKITENTSALMPVHVFGNPCNVEAIEEIAIRHNLKVIYDAAHAVGSIYKGRSLLNWGDISATSLHATKLLNTGEGGGCITKDDVLFEKLKRIRFFGHDEQKDVVEDGFNGKMTEIHAAMGLANLKYHEQVLMDRKNKYKYYKDCLKDTGFVKFQVFKSGEANYSYFPIIIDSEERLLKIQHALNNKNIFPRRYFYPSVNIYNKVVSYTRLENSEEISRRILCLPLYWKLSYEKIDQIISIVKDEN